MLLTVCFCVFLNGLKKWAQIGFNLLLKRVSVTVDPFSWNRLGGGGSLSSHQLHILCCTLWHSCPGGCRWLHRPAVAANARHRENMRSYLTFVLGAQRARCARAQRARSRPHCGRPCAPMGCIGCLLKEPRALPPGPFTCTVSLNPTQCLTSQPRSPATVTAR